MAGTTITTTGTTAGATTAGGIMAMSAASTDADR